jgi:para-aminobenzoate synthetase component 1
LRQFSHMKRVMTGRMTAILDIDQLLRAAADLPRLACFDSPDGATLITWSTDCSPIDCNWDRQLRPSVPPECGVRFEGGYVGWLAYEAGAQAEQMPTPRGPRPAPDSCMWRVDGALILAPDTGCWASHGTTDFLDQAAILVERARHLPVGQVRPAKRRKWSPAEARPLAHAYTRGVAEILEAIAVGEVYQVNLAWEHTGIAVDDALGVWLAIRHSNPAQYGAYIRCDGTEVVSNSPELFLQVESRTGRVLSRPIKGTASMDEGAREALERSPKERAELTMIVDLVRNDLGRVAQAGTVRTTPREIRRCGDLWHAEQTISATLRTGCHAVDALKASFPPGSVTGAPKVKAMEVIRRLEPGPRGIYTGAIGWLSDGGDACFSVAIRTATVQNGQARFHVGAGIVADSNPEDEWRETLAKAQALATSLGA